MSSRSGLGVDRCGSVRASAASGSLEANARGADAGAAAVFDADERAIVR
jgi:hypothetical protein